ncbi:hypothetical protein PHSC3_001298 [Chlamydiales bacterium STE3]|nr:hypothetical protein PHSC3_001298 [Chlamydiales bacterium STE3]
MVLQIDRTVYEGCDAKIIIGKRSYGTHSYKIKPLSHEWMSQSYGEIQFLMQKITAIWAKRNTTDFLLYAHKKPGKETFSGYHFIPYPKSEWAFWKQLKVLWHTVFGPTPTNKREVAETIAIFHEGKTSFFEKPIHLEAEIPARNDPFCNSKQIEKQLVYEGEHINILFNYAPLVSGKSELHLLLVPKEHITAWEEMPHEAFVEAEQFSHAITYKFQGNEIYYLIKKGKRAGQTQEHGHKHLVIVTNSKNAALGKLRVLGKMLFGASPLSAEALKNKVNQAKEQLKFTQE